MDDVFYQGFILLLISRPHQTFHTDNLNLVQKLNIFFVTWHYFFEFEPEVPEISGWNLMTVFITLNQVLHAKNYTSTGNTSTGNTSYGNYNTLSNELKIIHGRCLVWSGEQTQNESWIKTTFCYKVKIHFIFIFCGNVIIQQILGIRLTCYLFGIKSTSKLSLRTKTLS